MVTKVRQFVCGLHGHDAVLHFEQERISLQCTSCGFETPGWNLKASAVEAKPAPARFFRLPLLGERRVA